MVSQEAKTELEDEIVKQEEEEVKEKNEEKAQERETDSVLDDQVEGEEEQPERELQTKELQTVHPQEDEEISNEVIPPDSDQSEAAQLLQEAGVDFIVVNGFLIVKDSNTTVGERVKHTLPEDSTISMPQLTCADYHTIMDTKQRRRSLLSQIKDSAMYKGLSDTAKVVRAALQAGDFATADSRFYKKTLADNSWISEEFYDPSDIPDFIDLGISLDDRQFTEEGQPDRNNNLPFITDPDLLNTGGNTTQDKTSAVGSFNIPVPFTLQVTPAGEGPIPANAIPIVIAGLNYYIRVIPGQGV
jgi:hypothetical protein